MDGRSLSRLWAVAANTFRETVRERVLYNLVFFALLMTVSALLLGRMSIRQDEKIIKDLGLASMELFGIAISLFIGVGLVSKEIEKRSLYPLLVKPLGRGEFLVGKFLGLALTLAVNVGVMTVGLYLTLVATGSRPDVHLLKAVYGIYLGLLVVVAIALLFSTLTSSALASVCTLGLVIAGRFSDVIKNMRDVVPGAPGWLTGVLSFVIPDLQNFDFKSEVVHGDFVAGGVLLWASAYALLYVAVVMGAALAVFRSRDL